MDPDQPAQFDQDLQTLLQVEKLIANNMDPDLTARLRKAGLDPCWSQTHYVGFVVTRLKYAFSMFIFFTYVFFYLTITHYEKGFRYTQIYKHLP
jgi:hypothetical protein